VLSENYKPAGNQFRRIKKRTINNKKAFRSQCLSSGMKGLAEQKMFWTCWSGQ